MSTEALPFTAWIWRNESTPGAERRQRSFATEKQAKIWLCQQLAQWPESFEYGIDKDNADAVFLSDGIRERIGLDVEGPFDPHSTHSTHDTRFHTEA